MRLPTWKKRQETLEGPFKANRILDTEELKIDQVFTQDGKPVALFTHATNSSTKQIDVSGYAGPIGGKVGYSTNKESETRAFYLAENVSEELIEPKKGEIIDVGSRASGSQIPCDIKLEGVSAGSSIPIIPGKIITGGQNGSIAVSGEIISGSPADFSYCTYCGKFADGDEKYCKGCGRSLALDYHT